MNRSRFPRESSREERTPMWRGMLATGEPCWDCPVCMNSTNSHLADEDRPFLPPLSVVAGLASLTRYDTARGTRVCSMEKEMPRFSFSSATCYSKQPEVTISISLLVTRYLRAREAGSIATLALWCCCKHWGVAGLLTLLRFRRWSLYAAHASDSERTEENILYVQWC